MLFLDLQHRCLSKTTWKKLAMNLSSPSVFSIRGLPRDPFGDSYVIVSTWQPATDRWIAEWHVLRGGALERFSGCVECDTHSHIDELRLLDKQFVEDRALGDAESYLIAEMDRHGQADDSVLPEFEPSKVTLGHLWGRQLFRKSIAEISGLTRNDACRRNIDMIRSMPGLRAVVINGSGAS